ncbi:HAMP domain-containing sensor histidine kinase [Sulfitobacter sp. S190]|uniref:sensor histidine kinase n=1 Tax=Sulfitobacter sp. S190 TaxID=2867022 RepID=UPI0021A81233|nr:sensor histidine kinase [Sulfitobacter sp. S190]UWR22540.1 hypothetical protein K3756_00625 [Sulfitobacter sp. S190]
MDHPILTMRSAAHDIRGYLASAALATEHLSTHADAQVARRAARIARAIDHVVNICQTDLADAERTPTATPHDAPAIHAVLEQIGVLIAPQFEDRFDHPLFKVSVAPDVALRCDQTALFRLLYNLAVNAANAVRSHKGSTVSLHARRERGDIHITVADDGPGLPAHIIDHLFPRIDRPSPPAGRIGYGLMTAVGLAKEMGADLHLQHSSPDGTAFSLVLPDTPR